MTTQLDGRASDAVVQAERSAFTETLVAEGVLVPTSRPGIWGRSGAFEAVVLGLSSLVTEAGRADAERRGAPRPPVLRFGPIIGRDLLVRSDYLASFPDLVGSIHGFAGGDREHASLLAEVAAGGDWSAQMAPTDLVLSSAACHSFYATVTSAVPENGLWADVMGLCFRNEPSDDPARMRSFRMHEHVAIGSPQLARQHRDKWVETASELLTDLGLSVEVVVANDPFFGRTGQVLAAGQRDQALKLELVATVSSTTTPTAIASSNLHADHIGHTFGLTLEDGSVAHSACMAFGLERTTLALYRAHGPDSGTWPEQVRLRLALGA